MTAIVPHPNPTLAQWTENRISAILKSTTAEAFDKSFEEFLAKDAHITVNGAPISREEYRARMLQMSAAASLVESVKLNFTAVVEKQTNKEHAGSVGVFCEEIVYEKLRVLGGAEEVKITFSANVVIKQDPTLPRPPPGGNDVFEERRVFVANEVLSGAPVPVRPIGPISVPPLEPPAGH